MDLGLQVVAYGNEKFPRGRLEQGKGPYTFHQIKRHVPDGGGGKWGWSDRPRRICVHVKGPDERARVGPGLVMDMMSQRPVWRGRTRRAPAPHDGVADLQPRWKGMVISTRSVGQRAPEKRQRAPLPPPFRGEQTIRPGRRAFTGWTQDVSRRSSRSDPNSLDSRTALSMRQAALVVAMTGRLCWESKGEEAMEAGGVGASRAGAHESNIREQDQQRTAGGRVPCTKSQGLVGRRQASDGPG